MGEVPINTNAFLYNDVAFRFATGQSGGGANCKGKQAKASGHRRSSSMDRQQPYGLRRESATGLGQIAPHLTLAGMARSP